MAACELHKEDTLLDRDNNFSFASDEDASIEEPVLEEVDSELDDVQAKFCYLDTLLHNCTTCSCLPQSIICAGNDKV